MGEYILITDLMVEYGLLFSLIRFLKKLTGTHAASNNYAFLVWMQLMTWVKTDRFSFPEMDQAY